MVPVGKVVVQLPAQLSPMGELVTVPLPVPGKLTDKVAEVPPPPPEPVKHTTFPVM